MAEEIQHKSSERPKDKLLGLTQKAGGKARPPAALEAGNPVQGELHELLSELWEPMFRELREKSLRAREELAIATRYAEYKQLTAHAVEVFGNEAEAGPDRVLDTLGGIEHGVYF